MRCKMGVVVALGIGCISIGLTVAFPPSLAPQGAHAAKRGPLPEFTRYPVTSLFHGAPAEPVLNTSFARRFRTRIRTAAKKGPNFAGNYTVASWGCGITCLAMVVVDERTGAIYSGPFRMLDYDGALRYPDGSSWPDGTLDPLSYRLDSRLLVVRGCADNFEQKNCALSYYEWTGESFRLIEKLPAARVAIAGH
jgi:hypothetical protein